MNHEGCQFCARFFGIPTRDLWIITRLLHGHPLLLHQAGATFANGDRVRRSSIRRLIDLELVRPADDDGAFVLTGAALHHAQFLKGIYTWTKATCSAANAFFDA
jgi:hypothetical protein